MPRQETRRTNMNLRVFPLEEKLTEPFTPRGAPLCLWEPRPAPGHSGSSPQVANAVDTQVSAAMQQYWTNFAKTGDPNGGQLPVWPMFDTSTRAYIQFLDTGPVAKAVLRRPYCDLFMENVERLRAK